VSARAPTRRGPRRALLSCEGQGGVCSPGCDGRNEQTPKPKGLFVQDQFDLTTLVVLLTVTVILSLCAGVVWLVHKYERLAVPIGVGLALAALLYGVILDAVQPGGSEPAKSETHAPAPLNAPATELPTPSQSPTVHP